MEDDRELQGWLSGSPPPQESTAPASRTARRRWTGAGLVLAGAVAGGVLAGTLGASAATNGSSDTAPAAAGYSVEGGGAAAHGSAPVRSDEKSLSASLTATLTEKAKAAVLGGTVYRVESDAGDAAYEAHMTKSDGTEVTVKFDKSGNVTAVESGMGKGDPGHGGPGGPGGPGDVDGPGGGYRG
jgi:hypothetical protein